MIRLLRLQKLMNFGAQLNCIVAAVNCFLNKPLQIYRRCKRNISKPSILPKASLQNCGSYERPPALRTNGAMRAKPQTRTVCSAQFSVGSPRDLIRST